MGGDEVDNTLLVEANNIIMRANFIIIKDDRATTSVLSQQHRHP